MFDAYLIILLERLFFKRQERREKRVLEHRNVVRKSDGRIILCWI